MARKKKLQAVDVEPDFSKVSEEEKQFIKDSVMPAEDISLPPPTNEELEAIREGEWAADNSILPSMIDYVTGEVHYAHDVKQVTTKVHAKIYDKPDLSGQRIHLILPENFVVYAALVREAHKRTLFYEIAEGELLGKFIDKDEIESVLPLDN